MIVFVKISSSAGNGLGPEFVLTSDAGSVTPSVVTKTQLIAGIYVTVSDLAKKIKITSQGSKCTNFIEQAITGITTTTTSTTSTTTTSTTTSTTTAPPCINPIQAIFDKLFELPNPTPQKLEDLLEVGISINECNICTPTCEPYFFLSTDLFIRLGDCELIPDCCRKLAMTTETYLKYAEAVGLGGGGVAPVALPFSVSTTTSTTTVANYYKELTNPIPTVISGSCPSVGDFEACYVLLGTLINNTDLTDIIETGIIEIGDIDGGTILCKLKQILAAIPGITSAIATEYIQVLLNTGLVILPGNTECKTQALSFKEYGKLNDCLFPPILNAQPALNFPDTLVGQQSTPLTFTLSGYDLVGTPGGTITLTAPSTDFQLSLNGVAPWTPSITVPFTSEILNSTTIYVRFTPQTTGGTKSGNIAISGGGATTTLAVTGVGVYDFVFKASALEFIKFDNIETTGTYGFKMFWGDSPTPQTYGTGNIISPGPIHTYTLPYTGDIKLRVTDLANVKQFNIAGASDKPLPNVATTVIVERSELIKLTGLLSFKSNENVRVTGITTANLNPTLTSATIWFSDISGSITDLPLNLEKFDIRSTIASGPTPITGSISIMYGVPPTATRPNLKEFFVSAPNNISGNISTIPSNATLFLVSDNNTITGNFSSLSDNSALEYFVCTGANTIQGNIEDVDWTNIVRFEVGGIGVKTGNIDNITPFNSGLFGLSFPSVSGTTSGITGSLSSLPPSIEFLNLNEATITGDAGDIPTNCTTFVLGANGTLGGVVTNLPVNLEQFVITGNNHDITGNIFDLPSKLRFVKIEGNSHNVSGYSGTGRSWGTPSFAISGQPTMCKFSIYGFAGGAMTQLNQTQSDNLIIDLAATLDWRNSSSFSSLGDAKAVNYNGLSTTGAGAIAEAALEASPRLVPVNVVV
jgi:hypothetical protein